MNLSKDICGITVKLAAQVVWYFIEGVTNRHNSTGEQTDKFVTYKVEVKDIEKPLVFLQCPETLRWWMEVQSIHNEKTVRCLF